MAYLQSLSRVGLRTTALQPLDMAVGDGFTDVDSFVSSHRTEIWLIGITAVVVLVAIFLGRSLIRRANFHSERGFEAWISGKLSKLLSTKLNLPNAELEPVLRGARVDSVLHDKIDSLVSGATIEFSRSHPNSGRTILVTVRIVCYSGVTLQTTEEHNWDDIPASIRSEFLLNSSETISRQWNFVWRKSS